MTVPLPVAMLTCEMPYSTSSKKTRSPAAASEGAVRILGGRIVRQRHAETPVDGRCEAGAVGATGAVGRPDVGPRLGDGRVPRYLG